MVIFIVFNCVSLSWIGHGVDPNEFKACYKKNEEKFIKQLDLGDINYTMTYIPVELKILNMQRVNKLTKEQIREVYSDFEHAKEFLLQISISGYSDELVKYPNENQMSYTERISYLSFGMKSDIQFVLDSQDTIACSEYVFERNFGTSPKVSILIGFETDRKYKKIQLLMNDKLFNNEDVSFEFNVKDMKGLPKLKNI